MTNKELKLDKLFKDTLGSNNVYFQPPESVRMQYPCIVWNLAKIPVQYADDKAYLKNPKYVIRYISTEPDDPMRLTLTEVLGVPMIQVYNKDGLYHYIYELYY